MEVTLVHPDAPELEFKPSNAIELSAYKSQGFVEKDKFAADTQAADEVTELKEKLAKETEARKEAEAKAAEAEERARSAEAEAAKVKADAEAATQTAKEKAEAEAEAAKKKKEVK